jgi:hypothetical protein
MPTQRLTFSEWLPDQPSVLNTIQDITNLIPLPTGYFPFPLAVDFSGAASESLNNTYAGKFGDTIQIFAGSSTKLYKFDNTTTALTDVSKSGGYGGTGQWKFLQYGNRILACNNHDKIQAWTLGSSSAWIDVASTAPIARHITNVRDFVVTGYLDGGTNANKLQWSDINDETNWTPSSTSQSDYQIIADGGNITGLTGGEFGLVLLERAIYRMSYIGTPLIFQFDAISRNLGCAQAGSVAQYAENTYFLSQDGFYVCDGHTVQAIGVEKVDRYFYKTANSALLDTISTAIDPIKKLVIWNYPNVFGGRTMLLYNWLVKKWSKIDTDVNYISSTTTVGTSLEGISSAYNITAGSFVIGKSYTITSVGTTSFTSIGASANAIGIKFTATGVGSGTGTATDLSAMNTANRGMDSLTTSLDDRLFSGGKFLFAGVRGNKIVTFTGSNDVASITIGDWETGYNAVITLIRPQIEDGGATVSISSRKNLGDNISFGATSTVDSLGRCSVRSAGRYHQIKVVPTGNWTSLVSIDVDTKDQGNR